MPERNTKLITVKSENDARDKRDIRQEKNTILVVLGSVHRIKSFT